MGMLICVSNKLLHFDSVLGFQSIIPERYKVHSICNSFQGNIDLLPLKAGHDTSWSQSNGQSSSCTILTAQ